MLPHSWGEKTQDCLLDAGVLKCTSVYVLDNFIRWNQVRKKGHTYFFNIILHKTEVFFLQCCIDDLMIDGLTI